MKSPEQMNDQELAEAVAVEVLGLLAINYKDNVIIWESEEDAGWIDILSPDGREAIEDALEARELGWRLEYSPNHVHEKNVFKSEIFNTHGIRIEKVCLQKNRYRAIAIAALNAVRGEG